MSLDILIIGGGASGLMAAYAAGRTAIDRGDSILITILEKMPRPARKLMISGKGRCNFTNVKEWNEFSAHIRSKASFVKSSFYAFPSSKVLSFFEDFGMKTVVERGDRAFPASYHAGDVVDTLVSACHSVGVKIETQADVADVSFEDGAFVATLSDSRRFVARRLVIATGGLSYPSTGSTGDGFRWAECFGHSVSALFPSLTALVPRGYKNLKAEGAPAPQMPRHIHRETPLSDLGQALCGLSLKNVGVSLLLDGELAQEEFGDVDFTDGGMEGPVGFQISRKAVKSLLNGGHADVVLDLKPGVPLADLKERVKDLWTEIDKDPRSLRLHEKEKCRILLGKLMPWDMIPAFRAMNPDIVTLERRGRDDTKLWINLPTIAKSLKNWVFRIDGFVGYERSVVTAGGVDVDELISKTMESRIVPGLYFCGEVMDLDADTGGYNLQSAFSTGYLAGQAAAKSLSCYDKEHRV